MIAGPGKRVQVSRRKGHVALGTIANQRKKKLPYEQAKAYVQAIGIKTWFEYTNWSKNGQRPNDIPAAPDKAYREFEGWGKFLGTDRVDEIPRDPAVHYRRKGCWGSYREFFGWNEKLSMLLSIFIFLFLM